MLLKGCHTWVIGVVAAIAVAPAAHAQWAVVDVGAIVQLLQQVQLMEKQLQTAENDLSQAQQAYQSMTGPRGMQNLLSGTNRNYLPADWQTLQNLLSGSPGGYGTLAGQLQTTLRTNSILTSAQLAQLSPQERSQLQSARNSAAALQVSSQQALDASSQRFASLQQLINAIPTATDQKSILDLQARIAAEQVMLQNENTKLMVLYHAAQAQELTRAQQARELSIANHGSLRALPPIGLKP
jgi:type IV secretion system protein VirB5